MRDLGLDMPKPKTQSWNWNPPVQRTVTIAEQPGQYMALILLALEEGSRKDGLDFTVLDFFPTA